MTYRVLLLGLGNDVRSDDAAGLAVVREVRRRCEGRDAFDVEESSEMGIALLDYITGYDDLVLVDSVLTGRHPPGTLLELDEGNFAPLPGVPPHRMGIPEVLAIGRALGLPMPGRVRIIALEVKDPFTVGTEMSTEVRASILSAVDRVIQCLGEIFDARGGR